MKPTRKIPKQNNAGLWTPKRKTWMFKNDDDTLGEEMSMKEFKKKHSDEQGYVRPKDNDFLSMMDDYEKMPIRLKGGKKVYR